MLRKATQRDKRPCHLHRIHTYFIKTESVFTVGGQPYQQSPVINSIKSVLGLVRGTNIARNVENMSEAPP